MTLIQPTIESIKKRGHLFAHISEAEYQNYLQLEPVQRKYYELNLERRVKAWKAGRK